MHFEHMILSDEAAEKNLLIQLADRNVISVETLRDRFGELHDIEDSRIKTEGRKRNRRQMPPKADPYHNANVDSDYRKIALQKGEIGIDDVTVLKPRQVENTAPTPNTQQEQKQVNENCRPKFSNDIIIELRFILGSLKYSECSEFPNNCRILPSRVIM